MFPLEHSAILLTCIKQKSVLKTNFWSFGVEAEDRLYNIETANEILILIALSSNDGSDGPMQVHRLARACASRNHTDTNIDGDSDYILDL